ncbi:endothelin-converting enzyme 2-like [Dermacentor silvarum]|uniref:endothelin-converting enzyme 2-like n=1 Tax=Dermacentor silvarum TaxID=543639 RepID=UPI002101639D|nr:endothelin-converting enzyme 2-like [Dermacentor silvarum]
MTGLTPATTPDSSFPSHTIKQSHRSVALIAATGLATTLLFCSLVYILLYHRHSEGEGRDNYLCFTEECRFLATVLDSWLNRSVDPCEDFNGHVCSKWLYNSRSRRESWGVGIMRYGMRNWEKNFELHLTRAAVHFPIAKQLLNVFNLCVAPSTQAESQKGVAKLKEFMRELRIPWPEPSSVTVDPLEVVFDLSLNWRVGPWFDVTVSQPTNGSAVFALRPAALCRVWVLIEEEVLAAGAQRDIWDGLYREFAPGATPLARTEIDGITKMHRDIYEEFRRAVSAIHTAPSQCSLQEIESHVANVTPSRWIHALSVTSRRAVLASDYVAFADRTLLEAVSNVFFHYSNGVILRHLSWAFIQVFSSLADRRFLVHTLGSQTKAQEQRLTFCVTEMDAAYRWLIVALRVLVDFPPQKRTVIDDSLNDVTQTVLNKLANLSWAEADFREALMSKVQRTSVTLWPSSTLLTENGLSKFFGGWFSDGSSFTEDWITAAKQWRQLISSSAQAGIAEHPRNFLMPFIRYDHFLNTVRVALAALSPPWYYALGTKAMTYGGIGFYYALQLVRSFDSVGLQVDPEGSVSTSWLPTGFKRAIAKKAACLGPTSGLDHYFPEIAAMEAAHAAFDASLDETDRFLKVAPSHSEDQLFFIVACLAVCGLHDALPSLRVSCNKAVAGFAPFAKAFRCRGHAAMNPPKKCPFFE